MTAPQALYGKAITLPDHVLVREVADEAVILSLESEEYFGLDPVGTRMFQLLREEATVQSAFHCLLIEYDVDEATLAHDLEALIAELRTRKLIDLVDPGLRDAGR